MQKPETRHRNLEMSRLNVQQNNDFTNPVEHVKLNPFLSWQSDKAFVHINVMQNMR